jgi:hypothetical protein
MEERDMHEDSDDQLIEDLRRLFAKDDPVPPLVLETAKASLGWRRLDADLAELLSDSVLDAQGEMALARGTAQLRSVSFSAGRLTIDLELQGEGSERRLLGQLGPPAGATLELQLGDAETAAVPIAIDELGRFRARLPDATRFRLRVGLPDAAAEGGIGYTETSWVPL